ncbi:M50 family metallopeptidase [Sphingomonas abietis]|uniref:M50 family metallopeptidase n=1 Tax=Sphingomonas abietis TaxID=3012344 RepID=A0ABY7NRS4_9SPHN|nr:M50 family metallopeptidase [Sphingomonas abietis]WBO24188.1 M50 family metallopeptidase [Sphingomonas abietis]
MNAVGGLIWAIACFLVVIGPLIFIHEMGHYLVGRWFGVKAEAFSIGFGNEVVGWTDKRGTRWKIATLPLGGYVRFAGDMNPASQPSPEWLSLPAEERRQTFQAKPVWQRFLIVFAGPAVNFLFAFVVIAGVLVAYGEPVTPPVISAVLPHSAAASAGLQVGDRIVSLDGGAVRRFEDVGFYTALHPDMTVQIGLIRAGRALTVPAHMQAETLADKFGNKARIGRLGIYPIRGAMRPVPLIEVPRRSADLVVQSVGTTLTAIGQIIGGERSAKELSGPVGMARVAGEQATLGWFAMVLLMVGISINLGFINLLPIPMLDGGHLLFYIVEAVRRRPVQPQVQEWAFRSGLALLLGLMLFVTFNDLGSTGLWQKLAGLMG